MRTHGYFHYWGEILADGFLYDVPLAYPPPPRRRLEFQKVLGFGVLRV